MNNPKKVTSIALYQNNRKNMHAKKAKVTGSIQLEQADIIKILSTIEKIKLASMAFPDEQLKEDFKNFCDSKASVCLKKCL